MILVDSSIWIGYLNGAASPETAALDAVLVQQQVLVGDLILAEVLQGFRAERDYRLARQLLDPLHFVTLGGREVALAAADGYRRLRRRGVTVRKTIDMIIAAWCILNRVPLLHADRDFDLLESELGLQVWT